METHYLHCCLISDSLRSHIVFSAHVHTSVSVNLAAGRTPSNYALGFRRENGREIKKWLKPENLAQTSFLQVGIMEFPREN